MLITSLSPCTDQPLRAYLPFSKQCKKEAASESDLWDVQALNRTLDFARVVTQMPCKIALLVTAPWLCRRAALLSRSP